MKRRLIKRANLEVSELGFGCMSLGENHQQNERLIHAAIDGEINYFDTADLYQKGLNEVSVGKALLGKRSHVVLATKVGNEWSSTGDDWRWNPSKKYILKAVDSSLKRLQTDYIDIYQLHGGTIDDPIDEVIEAFEILRANGKIRHYGLSSIRPNVVAEYLRKSNVVSDMLQYSLLDRRPEEQLLPMLAQSDVSAMVRGGMAKGLLAGKAVTDYLSYKGKDIDLLLDKMYLFSNEKISLSHLSIQWLLANAQVTSVVIGIRRMNHLKDILKVAELEGMNASAYKELGDVLSADVYKAHRI